MASQIDRLKERIEKKIDKFLKKLEKDIATIIYNRSPWATSELREQGISVIIKQNSYLNYTLIATVGTGKHENSDLTYEQITRRLEIGINLATGLPLLRTQTSAGGKNKARTPTAGWWSQAVKDVENYVNKINK